MFGAKKLRNFFANLLMSTVVASGFVAFSEVLFRTAKSSSERLEIRLGSLAYLVAQCIPKSCEVTSSYASYAVVLPGAVLIIQGGFFVGMLY